MADITLSKWFKKSIDFWAEIEKSEPFITLPEIPLKEDNKEGVDGRDDENAPMELFTFIVIRVDDGSLPIGYKSVRDR